MVAFLKDPSGPPLWEENPEAKDIVHIETEKVSLPVPVFILFYFIQGSARIELSPVMVVLEGRV